MGKTFTLEEANRALVFVAPVLKEIQTIWSALMSIQGQEEGPNESMIRAKLNRLKFCNEELAQVGCLLKDPTEGILDFPTFYKNQPVFLCWKLGEEQVEHWYKLGEKFQDRHEIDENFIPWNSKTPTADFNLA